MIVNHPQFDTDQIKSSMLVKFKYMSYNGRRDDLVVGNWYSGIIVSVEPFKIHLVTITNKGSVAIELKDVLNGLFQLVIIDLIPQESIAKIGANPATCPEAYRMLIDKADGVDDLE